MDLVSVILESMDLDPLRKYESSDPYEMFSENGDTFLEEALSEAGKDANKKMLYRRSGILLRRFVNGYQNNYQDLYLSSKVSLRRNLRVQIK